jgi:hypothetical protein
MAALATTKGIISAAAEKLGVPERLLHRWFIAMADRRGDVTIRDGREKVVISAMGDQRWYRNRRLHRDGDLPAVVMFTHTGRPRYRAWYRHGRQHRERDKPAVISSDGARSWYINGRQYRKGGLPTFAMGKVKMWHRDGEIHRIEGLEQGSVPQGDGGRQA